LHVASNSFISVYPPVICSYTRLTTFFLTQSSFHECRQPTRSPTIVPTLTLTNFPTSPTTRPSQQPTIGPTFRPSIFPTRRPTSQPTAIPSVSPTQRPTSAPTKRPTTVPSMEPTGPSSSPTSEPSADPSLSPSNAPTSQNGASSSSNLALNSSNSDSGDAFIIIIIMVLSLLLTGYYNFVMTSLRSNLTSTLAVTSKFTNFCAIPFSCLNLGITIVLIREQLRDGSAIIALMVIVLRLLLVIVGGRLNNLLCASTENSSIVPYLHLRASGSFAGLRIFLAVLLLVDPTLIRLYPFNISKFTEKSNGFPNLWIFFRTNLITLIAYLGLFLLSISVMVIFDDTSWQVSMTMIVSFLMVVYVIMVLWLRLQVDHLQALSDTVTIESAAGGGKDVNVDKTSTRRWTSRLSIKNVYKKRESHFMNSISYGSSNPVEISSNLQQILHDMNRIFDKANNGMCQANDINVLSELFVRIDADKYMSEEYASMTKEWSVNAQLLIISSMDEMKLFVPSDVLILSCTLESLVKDGMTRVLAKRIFSKQSLWLITASRDDISQLTESDLYGKYNPIDQNLDIVELAAIYGALPKSFTNDINGKKNKWKLMVEGLLISLMNLQESGALSESKRRNPSYQDSKGVYGTKETVSSSTSSGVDPRRKFLKQFNFNP
jgi:hypothetical protein